MSNEITKGAKERLDSSDLFTLRIQSLIADKNGITAQANADLAAYDQWQADYSQWRREVDAELEGLFSEANTKVSHGVRHERN